MLFFLALPSSSLSLQPEKLTDHLHCHISFNPIVMIHFCCCSVAESSLTLCDAMDCSMLGFPVLHHLLEFAQTHVHRSVMPSNHVILCRLLLLLPSIFPSIRVFSNELALQSSWPNYWSFSFSISLSNEYSRLIYFRIDWFDLCVVQRTLESLL